jgi:hypothetical protein
LTEAHEIGKGVIKVRLLRAGRVLRSYKVRSDIFTIGTDPDSTIRAAGDPGVKPKHAAIYIDEGGLTLVPEPGAPVLLNGQPIDFAVPSPEDIIKIGKLTLQVELSETYETIPPIGRRSTSPPLHRPSQSAPASPKAQEITRIAKPSQEKSTVQDRPTRPQPSQAPLSSAPPKKQVSAPPRSSRSPVTSRARKMGGSQAPLPAPSLPPEPEPLPVSTMPSAAPLPNKPSGQPAAPYTASKAPEKTTEKMTPPPLYSPEDSISIELDLSGDDDETALYSMPDGLVSQTTPSVIPAPPDSPPMVSSQTPSQGFADIDPDYFFGEEDEETFEESFSLANQLLTQRRIPVKGPKEPYSVAHVIRVVDNRVVDAFGVVPDTPYRTVDGELSCYIDQQDKAGSSRLIIETGPTVSGEFWIKGEKRILTASPSPFKAQMRDGDAALLQGMGGLYKIEVYRPPLAPKAGQLFSISYPMLATVIVLALILHAAVAYSLKYIELDRIGDISAEEEEIFAEVIMEKPDTPKTPEEQIQEEEVQDAKSIAERAPKVSQRTIRKRIKNTAKQQKKQVSSLLNVLSAGSGKAGKSGKLKDLISNIDAVATKGSGSSFSIAGAIASLPGKGVNIARSGGGGAISTLSGDDVAGKETGIASLGKGKRKGKVRGKVTKMSSGARIGGSLSREDVLRVINSHIHAIQACYEKALMGNPALSGRIAMDWTVATTGRVKSVRVRSSTVGSPKVANCISGVIKRWKFPQPKGGEANITFPFLFRSGS